MVEMVDCIIRQETQGILELSIFMAPLPHFLCCTDQPRQSLLAKLYEVYLIYPFIPRVALPAHSTGMCAASESTTRFVNCHHYAVSELPIPYYIEGISLINLNTILLIYLSFGFAQSCVHPNSLGVTCNFLIFYTCLPHSHPIYLFCSAPIANPGSMQIIPISHFVYFFFSINDSYSPKA